MQVKVSEASGPVLDWMVAKCEGWDTTGVYYLCLAVKHGELATRWEELRYSSNWAFGGPIIERERLAIEPYQDGGWLCVHPTDRWYGNKSGPTPLIAAMRCYVVSKLGDTVEVPDWIDVGGQERAQS